MGSGDTGQRPMAAIGNKKGYTRGLFDTEAKEFDCKPYRISRSDRFLHQPGEDSRWRCCLLGQFPHILDALGHEDRAHLVAKGSPALPPHLLPGVVSVRHQVDAGETAQCPDVLLLESAPQRSHCRVSPLPQERASGDAGRGTGLTQPAQSNRGPIFRAESLLRRLLLGPVSSWAIFPHPCLMPVEIGHPSILRRLRFLTTPPQDGQNAISGEAGPAATSRSLAIASRIDQTPVLSVPLVIPYIGQTWKTGAPLLRSCSPVKTTMPSPPGYQPERRQEQGSGDLDRSR